MTFANPSAFFLALLAVPIVAFYLLKVKMRQVPVSTMMFWDEVFEEKQTRALWRTLRHPLSLIVQLLMLSFLILALADPTISSFQRQQRRLVLILDTSASMKAASRNDSDESDESRFDVAMQRVDRLIQSMNPLDEMAVVTAGGKPEVICGLTSYPNSVSRAVQAVTCTDGPTSIAESLQIARQLVAGHPNGMIVVITDGQFPDNVPQSERPRVQWDRVGEPIDNLAITRFQVRRTMNDAAGFEVLVEVSNFSASETTARLEIDLEDEPLDVIPLKLEPGEFRSQSFRYTSASGGILSAAIDIPDGLSSDNLAYAVLPERLAIPVTLVSPGNWFLEQVLEADDLIDLTVTTNIPNRAPAGGVLVLHRQDTETLPDGPLLIVEPMGSTEFWDFQGKAQQSIVVEQNASSPVLRHIRFDNVIIAGASRTLPLKQHTILVQTADGAPVCFTVNRNAGNMVVLTADLEQGDLALRTAFPILISNSITWLTGTHGELTESFSTSTVRRLELPSPGSPSAKLRSFELVSPSGRVTTVRSKSAPVLGPFSEVGVWQLAEVAPDDSASQVIRFACNLANPEESNVQRPAALPSGTSESVQAGGRPLWFYITLAAILLAIVEWVLFQRRWIS